MSDMFRSYSIIDSFSEDIEDLNAIYVCTQAISALEDKNQQAMVANYLKAKFGNEQQGGSE